MLLHPTDTVSDVVDTVSDFVDNYPSATRKFAEAERLLIEFYEEYDPDLFVVTDATTMLERFTKLGRLNDSAKARTARRLEKAHAHTSEGFKNPETWLSAITGESVGQAASKLETGRSVEAHPEVSEAFKAGKISEAQARQIASAADRCPEKAGELVQEAPWVTYGQLKKHCDEVRSASYSSEDEITRHERIRKSRFCRTWTDSEGAGRLEAKMTPDALAVILAGLGAFEEGIFSEARKSGHRESHQAYMADALVAMAQAAVAGGRDNGRDDGPDDDPDRTGTAKPRRSADPKALIRVRVDLEALLRGHAIVGETCSIPGVGAVPVALVRELLGEALLELVIKRGTDVTTVVSDSRYVRKALRIALEERDPICVVPGCDRSDPLEIDHWRVDFSAHGPTSIENLARLCPFHHDQKTYRGWVLEGGPGHWKFTKPDRTAGVDDTPGADCESESEDTDTAGARQARRRAAPANDPPIQDPLL